MLTPHSPSTGGPLSADADKALDSRQLLMKAARKIFSEQGLEGATVKQISDAAGVNVSLISYHFGGKEGLYRACLESFGINRSASTQRTLQSVNSAEEFRIRLGLFLEEFMAQHFDELEISELILRDCTKMHDGVTQEIFQKYFMSSFQRLVEFIMEAQKKDIVRADLDPLVVTGIFFGGFAHVLRTASLAKTQFGIDLADAEYRKKLISDALRSLTEGIFPRRATSQ